MPITPKKNMSTRELSRGNRFLNEQIRIEQLPEKFERDYSSPTRSVSSVGSSNDFKFMQVPGFQLSQSNDFSHKTVLAEAHYGQLDKVSVSDFSAAVTEFAEVEQEEESKTSTSSFFKSKNLPINLSSFASPMNNSKKRIMLKPHLSQEDYPKDISSIASLVSVKDPYSKSEFASPVSNPNSGTTCSSSVGKMSRFQPDFSRGKEHTNFANSVEAYAKNCSKFSEKVSFEDCKSDKDTVSPSEFCIFD